MKTFKILYLLPLTLCLNCESGKLVTNKLNTVSNAGTGNVVEIVDQGGEAGAICSTNEHISCDVDTHNCY